MASGEALVGDVEHGPCDDVRGHLVTAGHGKAAASAGLRPRSGLDASAAESASRAAGLATATDDAAVSATSQRSRLIVLTVVAVIFIGECSRGLIVPSLFLYLESVDASIAKQATGWALATFSAGRMVAGLVLGWWSSRASFRVVCLTAFATNILGQAMYLLSPVLGWGVPGIVLARLLVGAGTGSLTVCRAAIAAVSAPEDRTHYMALAGAAQFAGSALMPGVGSLLANLPSSGGVKLFNKFTAPAFLCVALDVGVMLWLLARFSADMLMSMRTPKSARTGASGADAPAAPRTTTVVKVGVGLFIALNFTARGVLSLVVAIGSPLLLLAIHDTDMDPVQDTGEMFLALGSVGFVVYIMMAVRKVTKSCPALSDVHLLVISFVATAAGDVILGMPGTRGSLLWFVTGAGLVWSIGAPIAGTVVVASFSKILGSRPQGLQMGLIGAAGSVGRILIPLLASVFSGAGAFVFAGVLALGCAVAVVAYDHWVARATRARAISGTRPTSVQYVQLTEVNGRAHRAAGGQSEGAGGVQASTDQRSSD